MASVLDEVVGIAQIRSGRLFIKNRREFDYKVRRLDERWMLEVCVKRLRASRSIQQNRYYFGVVLVLISEHTGYSADELHDVLKAKFLPKHLAFSDGNGEVKDEFVIGGSTRKLNTVEFGEYMESIRRWAAEDLDVVIPDPREVSNGPE